MKHSKSDVRCKTTSLPKLRFDDQKLTSFAGLVIFQQLFFDLELKRRISRCFSHRTLSPIFSTTSIVILLIVNILLGYRRLRDVQYIKNDPLVLRLLGMRQMPGVSTISRQLQSLDDRSVEKIQRLVRTLVVDGLEREQFARVTLDFDGSVLGTCRLAEGVAIGFNRKKKGQRSYYPLYCTVAQTAQVLAMMHRSGNVHDSKGASPFIRECVETVRKALPQAKIETRMDAAFFSEAIIELLDELGVEYTISVPHQRYHSINEHIKQRCSWHPLNGEAHYFEKSLSLKSWSIPRHRFIFVRQCCKVQDKEPLQLDLFLPYDFNYQYKAVITNKSSRANNVITNHEGRGSQEGLFAELKSQAALSYIPCNTWNANKLYMLCNVIAHNLCKELQMRHRERERNTTSKRPAVWKFCQISTLRKRIIQRAGRLIQPEGQWTLSMAANDSVRDELMQYLPTHVLAGGA